MLGKRKAEEISKEKEEREQRDMVRYAAKMERIREQRLEFAGKTKAREVRKRERDITERIALGQAQPTKSDQVMFDQRLYNQTSGIGTGFGDEDDYNIYDKPLFSDKTSQSIYKGLK